MEEGRGRGGGGAAAGDPFINFLITGAGNTVSIGMDNNDSDYFKITDGASPSNGNIFAQLNPATFTWTLPVYTVNQQITYIGQPVWHNVYNQDNTNINSEAFFRATTGGAAGGDPYINFNITGVGSYSVGIDNSDSDIFKINYGANPSVGVQLFTMTTAGLITLAIDLPTSDGGTGRSAHTIHGVLIGNAGGAINATAAGVAGQHLVSGGPLADPTWASGGIVTWQIVAVSTPLLVNYGFLCNAGGALSFSLPAISAVGDVVEVVLDGAGS
jgi:hypothetical protein